MPKLAAYDDLLADAQVTYELWEDAHGEWQATMKLSASGEDAIDVANKIARAMRLVAREKPDHARQCKCALCTEWKVENSKERLGA